MECSGVRFGSVRFGSSGAASGVRYLVVLAPSPEAAPEHS